MREKALPDPAWSAGGLGRRVEYRRYVPGCQTGLKTHNRLRNKYLEDARTLRNTRNMGEFLLTGPGCLGDRQPNEFSRADTISG
jgi:hypothetical protein